MDKSRIAELRRLCEAATPGPWVMDSECGKSVTGPPIGDEGCDEDDMWVPELYVYWSLRDEADARFIAAARSALPELLDEIERLVATR